MDSKTANGKESKIFKHIALIFTLSAAFVCSSLLFSLPSAYAATQLSVGEYRALSGVPASSDYADGLLNFTVKSTDESVVSCSVTKPEGYTGSRECFAHARGFGSAKVTASWKVIQNVYNKKTKKFKQKTKSYEKTFEFNVQQGKIKARYCDHIYAGKKYNISALFKSCAADNDVSYLPKQGDGTFATGTGYSVTSDGKKVKFDKATSNVTVLYQTGSTTYPIKVAVVHSKDSVVSKIANIIKKAAYVPASFRIKSVGFSDGKVIVKFSLVNLAGVTKISKISAGFTKGSFKYERLKS